jgi:hypothetical protein
MSYQLRDERWISLKLIVEHGYFVVFRSKKPTLIFFLDMRIEFSPAYLRRLQRREQQAFSELYNTMADRLYRYIA